MIAAFDNALMSVATRVSHEFQKTFGPTNFWLAHKCLVFWIVAVTIRTIDYWVALTGKKQDVVSVLLAPLAFWLIAHDMRECVRAERHHRSLSDAIYQPNFALRPSRFFRLLWLVVALIPPYSFDKVATAPMPWAMAVNVIAPFVIVAWNHFAAVVPLPPGETRLERFWNKVRLGLRAPLPSGAGL